jgi:hypothetical protein
MEDEIVDDIELGEEKSVIIFKEKNNFKVGPSVCYGVHSEAQNPEGVKSDDFPKINVLLTLLR